MKGRRNNICMEYLSVLGQQLRHALVEATMFQLIKVKLFENESHYTMFKYAITRSATEVILENCDIAVRVYQDAHVNKELVVAKEQMWTGWQFVFEKLDIEKEELVNQQLLNE